MYGNAEEITLKKIVIVEDENFMREELEHIYRKAGYEVVCVISFANPVEEILLNSPDLVLLDVNLPGMSGFEICRELKRRSAGPVLILTSRDQLKDELHALDLGADEFLTKPCHRERLLARTASLLRKSEGRKYMIEVEELLLDRRTYTLYAKDESVLLGENQGKILETLLLHQGEVVPKEMLFEVLWGTMEYIDENALQVNMTRLKKSMKALGLKEQIETVRGVGYRWSAGDGENGE